MAKREMVVRVVALTEGQHRPFREGPNPVWLEQLRYAGLINWIVRDQDVTLEDGVYVKQVFELYAPKGVGSEIWANQNADRMRSFGINAVACPAWKDATYQEREMGAEAVFPSKK